MSTTDPQDPVTEEVILAVEELIELGFIEVVGIRSDGQWLYGATPAGKKAVQIWGN